MDNIDDLNHKWKRILLIKPNYRAVGWDFYNMNFPPINLSYIASYTSDLDVEIDILDAKVKNLSIQQIKRKIQTFNPDLVGISVYVSAAINLSNQIAEIVKEVEPNITVVLGGRHPTFESEECLENEYVDIIVRGEGEITFRELLINGGPEGVDGISFKKHHDIIHNPERKLMSKEQYAEIRFPSRHLVKKNKYKMFTVRLETVETSRGCPYSCKFCTTWKVNNGKWRARPIKNVIEELRIISENKAITDIFFVDDELTANTKRVEDLCESIIKSKKAGFINDFKFFAQIRVDDIVRSSKMIEKMAEAGFWVVFIGIESVDEASLKEMRKGITFNHVLKALDILHENNILAIGNLIIGVNLNDTRDDIIRNIQIMKEVDIDIISFVILTPFPGSDTLEEMDKKGLVLTKNWSKYTVMEPVIRTNQLSPADLYELLFYSFHELKYILDIRKLLGRVRKSRGLKFLLNPKRMISAIKSFFAVRAYINGYNFLT
ncbi:MAG: radical SAM protein [Candidatus Lokiarchaeota archaeon]|nr:radical SAM protein [Candidatus Lokiarchaeota archaeon]MBD3201945.1 radical SAM protein [Candidatus Lokiarchaeota archaeon]